MPRGGPRENAGRKPNPPGTPPPTVTRAFRIKPTTDEAIKQAAALDNLTPTAWLERVVTQELRRVGLVSDNAKVTDSKEPEHLGGHPGS